MLALELIGKFQTILQVIGLKKRTNPHINTASLLAEISLIDLIYKIYEIKKKQRAEYLCQHYSTTVEEFSRSQQVATD